ncbi:response regulator transcription factor [Caballeronia sp. LZ062]|uniref:response regulator transcription factor n=1 Tax=unclassified Caballeronia TaxID=2646786 RepID=UPI0028556260|nr:MULTISPECIES: response regulator transcription factor [unclassified Caballeronia]MDR5857365.1 response regulator transcription factor [Caballeronia sp. LZ050]MDR5868916.1 response regulator transcription factor [Caballeronia sp. LZ062]
MENGYFKTVLLVEDEGLTRSAMKTLILANEPLLEIDEADGFEQAKAKLSANSYDLMFLDYHLRGQATGMDLLNWIREEEREVQTIMLSAQDDRDTVLECIRNGACGFISKGSEQGAGVFREALKTILNGRVYLPNTVLGKGGHSPKPVSTHAGVTIESLDLPPRLTETLRYLLQGLSNKAIARKMNISENTAKEYSSDLLARFHVTRRTFLIVEMARRGIEMPMGNTSSAS